MINSIQRVTRTLRGRLSLWYIISVLTTFTVLAVSIGMLLRTTLQSQIDHHLHITVNEAVEMVESYRGEEREKLMRNLVSAQGMTVVLLSPDGSPLIETNSPDVAIVTEHQLQKIMSTTTLYASEPVHFTESNLRFAAVPVEIQAGKGVVAVGYSTNVIFRTFTQLLLIIFLTIVLLVLPAMFFGVAFIKKQLEPLEEVSLQAQAFTTSRSLEHRIQVNPPTKELATIESSLNEMLFKLQKMFEKERAFFADAAHTLKTPLAIILSQIEQLEIKKPLRDELKEIISSASDMVQDLIFIANIDSSKAIRKDVSITKIMKDISELAKNVGQEKSLEITSKIKKNVYIQGDAKMLKRSLANIVFNAIQYTPKKGHIYIKVDENRDSIMITVKDTGRGIKKEDLSQVTKRFFRGKNTTDTKGSGLGLAISKAVVEQHDGTLSITSKINKGTTVKISLRKTP